MSLWTTPGAKRALGANAGGARIAAYLHGRINSFTAAQINATNPFAGTLGLYERMQEDQPTPPTPAQLRTSDAIPRLIRHFESTHQSITTQRVGALVSREHSWLAARPTCLTSDGGILIVTTTRDDFADEWSSPDQPPRRRMPARMITRVLHDLMVTGVPHAYVVCEIQGHTTHEIVVRTIRRGERGIRPAMRALMRAERDFYLDNIVAQQPPEPNVGDRDLMIEKLRAAEKGRAVVATAQQIQDVATWHQLEEQISRANTALDTIKTSLRSAMGTAEVLLAPDNVTRLVDWKQTRGFRPRDFEQEHPQIAAEHMRTQTIDVLDVGSLTAAVPDLARSFFQRPLCRVRSQAARIVLDLAA